ncbi:MAG: 1-deoxy-D-xylulose-5-phosphate reductoisomerase [Balneolaceae bacterium]
MSKQNLALLGSTGSIGTQALEIVERHPNSFKITALTANKNWKLLARQVNKFRPDTVLLCDDSEKKNFKNALDYNPSNLIFGSHYLNLNEILEDSDILLNSLVGFAGFIPTYNALKMGIKVALANKESLVVGGELINRVGSLKKGNLIPVDSEHSAMLQCLVGEADNTIKKIVITASGGPFRDWSFEQMQKITVEDALRHPNWDMGAKITVDSSTMMNKGLEIIEAHWLFNVPYSHIEPVIHPQSIIHSIIEFIDGSSKAQLGMPDMKVPILYALTYPDRLDFETTPIDYSKNFELTFEPVDFNRFPCLKLAMEAGKEGGFAPAVLNAANEIAVARFLKKEIGYIDMFRIIRKSLEKINPDTELSPEALFQVDKETRNFAYKI